MQNDHKVPKSKVKHGAIQMSIPDQGKRDYANMIYAVKAHQRMIQIPPLVYDYLNVSS